jgi:succinyl-CoA synthetase beta subunit
MTKRGLNMNIHEYQSKQILKSYGVNVPKGLPAFSVEEAVKNAKEIGSDVIVVKAQIHAGGRGKAGGVKLAKNIGDVETYAKELLGKTLVTHQTGPDVKRSAVCLSKKAPKSRRNTTSPLSSTVKRLKS